MIQYYSLLHKELVTVPEEEDIFTDTFLKLTYNFNPDKLFVEQFRYYFQLLKGAYIRDGRSC